ncbi:MAG: prefoldin subunit [Candidatus Micrarchaeia archaeon]
MPEDENDIEKLLGDYQAIQEQMKSFASLLDQLQSQKEEIEKAKEEVTNSTGKVYISVGGVLVETTKEKSLSDLSSKAELTELRISTTTKQYNELKSKEKQLSEKITQLYKQGGGESE